ncbi:MAG: Rid family hydrolase, partial [Paracoccus sp. (in: a-proteobacteria)]|nr:Rid family hydrolase [Paracoccus sp. (in: a-proteobacteria)]
MFKAILFAAIAAAPLAVSADEVIRHAIPDSDFPIAQAVEIPAGKATVYVSGAVPSMADPAGDPASPEAWGNMEVQTVSVLEGIKSTLERLDLGMGDVVKMQVFLVAPDGEPVDFAGFMSGYTQFFGTPDQP